MTFAQLVKQEGLKLGLEQGSKQAQVKIAERLLKQGTSIEPIMDLTDLSREETETL
jgi:predicted transposase/invertase (TIGR01784 family)